MASRTVRLPRAGAVQGFVAAPEEAVRRRYRANAAALTRASRLFAIYALLLVGLYGAFLAALWSSPAGLASNPTGALLYLSAGAALLAFAGFSLTLARTPRGVEVVPQGVIVTEFLGHRRPFESSGGFRRQVEGRYPAGLLSPEPTEMVRLSVPGRPGRSYLLAAALLPEVVAD